MFAVIKTGGKQYKVASGDVIRVEKLDAAAGANVDFAEVLMLNDGATTTLGTPLVAGACVAGTVVEQTRGPKIIVFKKKRRQNYRRRRGHRQDLTVVRITDILPAGATRKARPAAEPKPAPAAKPPAEKPKAKPAAEKAAKPAAKKERAPKAAAKKAMAKGGAKPAKPKGRKKEK